MKVHIQTSDTNLIIPVNSLTLKWVLKLGLRFGKPKPGSVLSVMDARQLDRLLRELDREKRVRGSWNLVEVESGDTRVTITV